MAHDMKEFVRLKIRLEELQEATSNFSSEVIGVGGFGKVYEGEVLHSKGRSRVAIKRLRRGFGQGDPEFWKEIMMLSCYSHPNLISLLGYCDQAGERILVYEYASNGSLDRHISSTALTWTQRLKICVDVARGLSYLHDHKGTKQRVLHRDIKSANILLDENWNAKLSDMGLSKLTPANQQHTDVYTRVVGTPGYCDPEYMKTYTLTKESDIYSFGVVLCEVLCGRLCFTYSKKNRRILVPLWKKSYQDKKLDQIIFKDLTPSMDPNSLETFSDIAFQCLHDSLEQRPEVSLLVKKLEIALKFQERHDMELVNAEGTSRTFGQVDELTIRLSKGKGLFSDNGKMKREGAKGNNLFNGKGGVDAVARIWWVPPTKDSTIESGRVFVHFDKSMGYTLEDILEGTSKITDDSSYGISYHLALPNGDQVAGILLKVVPTKTRREFEAALNLVGKIRHPNLLTMRAYYFYREEIHLMYDYMPKGNIADFLHHRYGRSQLLPFDWPARMRILKGVGRGLLSLHADHNIIHGNLTSHNVMLDENCNPKISDFGLSLPNIVRFHGYKPLSRMSDPRVNTKTDLYSLGIIMFELLTGKSPRDTPSMMGLDLVGWVEFTEKEKGSNAVFDDELMTDSSPVIVREMYKSLRLASDCVRQSLSDGPIDGDVQEVLKQLEKIRPETATSQSA